MILFDASVFLYIFLSTLRRCGFTWLVFSELTKRWVLLLTSRYHCSWTHSWNELSDLLVYYRSVYSWYKWDYKHLFINTSSRRSLPPHAVPYGQEKVVALFLFGDCNGFSSCQKKFGCEKEKLYQQCIQWTSSSSSKEDSFHTTISVCQTWKWVPRRPRNFTTN